jgi:undecaprenyl-diphosphatase
MDLFEAIVLAIIQGITEFLPVSSSAHLNLAPYLFHWPDPGLTFDIALHFGTLIAILIYFYKDWVQIIGQAFGFRAGTDVELGRNKNLLWLLVIGTIPGGIAGLLLEKYAETTLRSPILTGAMLIVFGLIMWMAERVGSKRRDIAAVNLRDAVLVGCSQALAIVPGVSRSGSTISAGMLLGLDRVTAARFSFLLSTPIIAGAALSAAHKLHKEGGIPPGMKTPMVVGVIVSAIVGAGVIALFLNFLRRRTLFPFVIYRVIFGIIVVALALFRASHAG